MVADTAIVNVAVAVAALLVVVAIPAVVIVVEKMSKSERVGKSSTGPVFSALVLFASSFLFPAIRFLMGERRNFEQIRELKKEIEALKQNRKQSLV